MGFGFEMNGMVAIAEEQRKNDIRGIFQFIDQTILILFK